MKELLKKLLSAYGATGREENVASIIREIVAPYVDETKIDALGNLICTRHGAGKKIMFAAHMDHIGFVVTDIDEKGFLRVFNVGGINWINSIKSPRGVRKRRPRESFPQRRRISRTT